MRANRRRPEGDSPGASARRMLVFGAVVVFALTLVAYADVASRASFFELDSVSMISANPQVHVTELTPSALLRVMNPATSRQPARPFAMLSFALNYASSGLDATAYRWTNVFLLAACGVGVLLFAFLFLRNWCDEQTAALAAVVACAVWTLHPLQTNQTTYVVQRMTSMAICGYLWAYVCYALARTRGRRWLVPAVVFAVIGVGSKEIACLLPLTCLLERYALDEGLQKAVARWAWLLVGGGVLLAAGAFVAVLFYMRNRFGVAVLSPWDRLLTEARVLWTYLGLFVAPLPGFLNLDRDVSASIGLFSPPVTALAVAAHLMAIGLSWWLWSKNRLVSLLVFLYYLHHVPESSIVPLELAFEHRMCLPGVFLAVLIGYLGAKTGIGAMGRKRGALVVAGATLAMAGVLTSLTSERNEAWASVITLTEDMAAKSPGKPRVIANLGARYYETGRIAEAEALVRRAVGMDSGLWQARLMLADILATQRDFSAAIPIYQELLRAGHEEGEVHKGYGYSLDHTGDTEGALREYQTAIRLHPGLLDVRYWMALANGRQGRYDLALHYAMEELKLNPGNSEAASIVRRLTAR